MIALDINKRHEKTLQNTEYKENIFGNYKDTIQSYCF